MGHGLPSVWPGIDHQAVGSQAEFSGCRRSGVQQMLVCAAWGALGHRGNGLSRDHQDMHWRDWGDVLDRNAMLVFIDDSRRNLSLDDAGEEGWGVVHREFTNRSGGIVGSGTHSPKS